MRKLIIFMALCLMVNVAWALQKNVASQKLLVYAYDSVSGDAVTGDAGNITANVWQDAASKAASDDTNPTELDASDAAGVYVFDMTQAETNADVVTLYAVSATAFVELDAVIIHTTPEDFPDAPIEDVVWDAVLTGASHNDATSAGKRLRQVEDTTVLREEEQAQAGSASTITLHNDASQVNDFYADTQIIITGDTGIGQSRHIHTYVGSTRVANIVPDWATNPDATSDYVIKSDSEKHTMQVSEDAITASSFAVDVNAEIAGYVWNALDADYDVANSMGLWLGTIYDLWDSLTITDGLLEVIHGNI